MSRRDLILEEMGLGPVWQLRRPGAVQGDAPAEVAAPVVDAPVAVAQAQVRPQVHAEPAMRPAEPARVSSAPAADAAADAQRRTRILAMDWSALKDSVAQCTACPLHQRRNHTVFGVGDEAADWLFVGEGPGAEEDAKGEPFVGQAGKLLDNMLAAIELARGEKVYIANVVKCRPPGNRNPEGPELSCCEPYLTRQIELIRPKLIVAMGRVAATQMLATNAAVAALRGRVHEYRGTPLIVTYHPAYLLRNMPDKAKSWADLCLARDTMEQVRARASAG